MNEYDAEYEALARNGEEIFLQDLLDLVDSGKTISPKDLASALRLERVTIPKKILSLAADYIDGVQRKRGKPIDVVTRQLKRFFTDRDFESEEIQAKFSEKKNNGLTKDEAIEELAAEYNRSESYISNVIYPRHQK